jgi:hypothetical protein
MALPHRKGYALVADGRFSIRSAYDLANGRESIVAIKAHRRWLLSSGAPDDYDLLKSGAFLVIAETQLGLDGEFFTNTMAEFDARVRPDVITLSSGLNERQIENIARLRDREFGELTLALTACLPEHREEDFVQYGGVAEFLEARIELAGKIGNAMVYGAVADIANIDTRGIPYMASGIRDEGELTGEKIRSTATMEAAWNLGADIVLLGSVLGDHPAQRLSALPKI